MMKPCCNSNGIANRIQLPSGSASRSLWQVAVIEMHPKHGNDFAQHAINSFEAVRRQANVPLGFINHPSVHTNMDPLYDAAADNDKALASTTTRDKSNQDSNVWNDLHFLYALLLIKVSNSF